MYSSEDLERFYFQYQTEALPHGESLQSFYVKNKVPYNVFQKWFKDTSKKVVKVRVDVASGLVMRKKTRPVINLNLYKKAVLAISFVYGLISVSVMDYTYPKRI